MRCQPRSKLLPDPVHSGDSLAWLAEALAAVRAEEAVDLAARLAEAKLQLAELGAVPPGSPQRQQAAKSNIGCSFPRNVPHCQAPGHPGALPFKNNHAA